MILNECNILTTVLVGLTGILNGCIILTSILDGHTRHMNNIEWI